MFILIDATGMQTERSERSLALTNANLVLYVAAEAACVNLFPPLLDVSLRVKTGASTAYNFDNSVSLYAGLLKGSPVLGRLAYGCGYF